ncbi:MAG: hypothetical protein L6Q71_03300 [Planctomycetes bacterium]|nr:hypothetical protein [Planctomycetota bacterium]NUQ33408.1 hypothetical protein [Planctomycetaceae bacterium]
MTRYARGVVSIVCLLIAGGTLCRADDPSHGNRDAEAEALMLRRIAAYFHGNDDDPASIMRCWSREMEQREAVRFDTLYRLRVATAALDSGEEAAQKLATESLDYPTAMPVRGQGSELHTPYAAIGTLWNALMANRRPGLAASVADSLMTKFPASRYAKRLKAVALMIDGKLAQAGELLADLLRGESKQFAWEYTYTFQEKDAAQEFWRSPLSLNDVPFCQEVRGVPLAYTVAHDLPEVELWARLAAADSAALTGAGQDKAWTYLKARAQFEQAAATHNAEACRTALASISGALGTGENPIYQFLDFRADVATGNAKGALGKFGPISSRLWPSPSDSLVVARQGMSPAAHGLVYWALALTRNVPVAQVAEHLSYIPQYFFPMGNPNDPRAVDLQRDAFMAMYALELERTAPERFTELLPALQEHLQMKVSGADTASQYQFFVLEHICSNAVDLDKAKQVFEICCQWVAHLFGPEGLDIPASDEARGWLHLVRLDRQSRVIPGPRTMPMGWLFPNRPDALKCAALAAERLVTLSANAGKDELAKFKTDIEEQAAKSFLPLMEKREAENANNYAGQLQRLASLLEQFEILRDAVSPAVASEVGEPDFKNIPKGWNRRSLRAALSASSNAGNRVAFVRNAADTLPAKGQLMPLEALVYTFAREFIRDDATREAAGKPALDKLDDAKLRLPLLGPALLRSFESLVPAFTKDEALARSVIAALMEDELKRVTKSALQGTGNPDNSRSPERVLYSNVTPETHWSFPRNCIDILGAEHRAVTLYQRSIAEQQESLTADVLLSANGLNAIAWNLHGAWTGEGRIQRMAMFGLAFGADVFSIPQAQFAAPSGSANIENVAHTLDTAAWGHFASGDVDRAVEVEKYARALNPGDRNYDLTLAEFEKERKPKDSG